MKHVSVLTHAKTAVFPSFVPIQRQMALPSIRVRQILSEFAQVLRYVERHLVMLVIENMQSISDCTH
jgi:hypothetical protein